jgi:hypothetical protein
LSVLQLKRKLSGLQLEKGSLLCEMGLVYQQLRLQLFWRSLR